MHFADRNFYCDWWNANNIDTFWRSWNMPVHRWCVRHIYIPVVDMGYSRSAASLIVFFISAFFHEYLVTETVLETYWYRKKTKSINSSNKHIFSIVLILDRWAFHWKHSKSGHSWAWWARFRCLTSLVTWKCNTVHVGVISLFGHQLYLASRCALWCTITIMWSHISMKPSKMQLYENENTIEYNFLYINLSVYANNVI